MAWKPGPTLATLSSAITPRDRSHGSVPPWHFYDVHELPHYRPDVVPVFVTIYDRKGNTTNVRLLKNGSGFHRDGGA